MKFTPLFFAAAVCLNGCAAAATTPNDEYVMMETRVPSVPGAWSRVAARHANFVADRLGAPSIKNQATHDLVFAIKQQNLDRLERYLQHVSDPKSPLYGQHMSFSQVGELVKNDKATAAVRAWLAEQGGSIQVAEAKGHGEYVRATAAVSVWERLLRTEFHEYAESGNRRRIFRAEHYSLPAAIAEHVSHVFFATHLPSPHRGHPAAELRVPSHVFPSGLRRLSGGRRLLGSDGKVTPAVINEVYNISSNTVEHGNVSIYESLGQNYSPDDLKAFQAKYLLPSDTIDKDIGGNDNSSKCETSPDDCGEANLDVQYLMAVAQGADAWYWSVSSDTDFADWITDVATYGDVPLVHSISYGALEEYTATSEATSFNTEAMKLGLRGITVVVSSGDDGVSNFVARSAKSDCGYHPSWPASSPYVVAAGATQGPENGDEEIACAADTGARITTGGGFSDKFEAPSWQTTYIADYFENAKAPFGTGYNTTGRGYPDIAMLGHNYQVLIGGSTFDVDGTSASAPVFAGVLALVNNARLGLGKSAVGWATPTLYSIYASDASIFNDVTSGANNCCAKTDSTICCTDAGFYAAKGWDPLTGLGSVNAGKLIDAWSAL